MRLNFPTVHTRKHYHPGGSSISLFGAVHYPASLAIREGEIKVILRNPLKQIQARDSHAKRSTKITNNKGYH